jgi:2-keto-4-pentenoate hydratase/2-oxohepta-3-ene-1,7-dioic acid hydratase in catechol pathway
LPIPPYVRFCTEFHPLILFASRAPLLFYKPVTSLIGPLASVIIPKFAQPGEKHLPDYEVELTIVIGKSAKNVSEDEALDYVLAYTAGNDVRLVQLVLAAIEQCADKVF